MPPRDACPCGSGRKYAACCAPLHRGEREAPDAETLMRSRYAAFARKEVDYLWRTLHPDHEDRAEDERTVKDALREACARHKYMGLRILDRRAPDEAGVARVLFLARVFEQGHERSFVELSEFAHDGAGWRYLRGRLVPVGVVAGDPEALTIATFPGR
ncbi:MAG: SEC-C domain-containing protein [Polyangiaceae bacterium]|nr:SEC-C domain-containing protein [Polyangiaceae bacterium]